MAPLPVVSFVVPVRNDARRLARCLESIGRLDYPSDRLEVVVADNGSTDGSDRVARDLGARLIPLPGRRVSQMRNEAVKATRGGVVAFVDADHEIGRAWARSAVETLQTAGASAAGAEYHAPQDGTWVQKQYDRLRRRGTGVRETKWLGSGNLAVWRSAFDAVGGFDTALETCEDVDFCRRLRARGTRVMSDSRLESTHFGDPATLGELFVGELWRGRDNVRVSLRSPRALRDLGSLLMPMAQLGLLVLALVGAVTASSRGPLLALVALAGLAATATLQSIRMLRSGASVRASDVVETFAVAGVYGIARALALVVRVPHRLRHQGSR